ncbi:MAG: glycosyltransferase [Planctomycetes bacterium]|nr:glycosyltransferase [Planctomycetota bacterium]
MKLSILVPAYNESRTIAEILRRLAALEIEKEIIVVDDGSSDDTYVKARALTAEIPGLVVVKQPENRGKGAAIRRALEEASGEVCVVQDADLEYDPQDLVRMLAKFEREKLDALYGSRRLGGRSDATHARYYWGGVLLSWITNRLYGSKLTDEPTCYKMVRTELLRSLELECEGFEFCPEVTAKLLRAGVRIPELKIAYHPRSIEEGKKIRLKDAVEAVRVLVRWRYRRLPGAHAAPLAGADRVGGAVLVLLLLALAFGNVLFGEKSLMSAASMPNAVHLRAGIDGTPLAEVPRHPTMDLVSAFIDEPLAVEMGRQIQDGGTPLWNPWNGAGAPLLGNMQSAPFSPFRWPILALPRNPQVYDLCLLLRFFVAGLGAFLFFRARAASVAASFAGAAGFGLCGYFVLHASMHHLGVEVWLPWLLLCADRIGASGGASSRRFLAWVFVCWASMTGGNPEATLATHLLLVFFVLAHLHRWGLQVLLPLGVGYAVAFFLALPYFLPAIEYLRNGAHHHEGTTGLDHLRWYQALNWFAPQAIRGPGGGVDPMAPPWLGAALSALAVLGATSALTRPRLAIGLPGVFFAAVALFCALKFTGFPVLNELGRAPLLDLLIFYKYGNPVLALAVAALAVLGIDRLRAREGPRLWEALLPLALLGLAALFASAARAAAEARGIASFAEIALEPGVYVGIGGVVLVALIAALRRGAPIVALPWLASALVAAELVLAAEAPRSPRRDPWISAPYADFVRAENDRALLTRGDLPRSFGPGGSLPPNANAALGIPDIRLHDGLYVARYERFVLGLLDPNCIVPQFDGGGLQRRSEADAKLHLALSAFHLERGLDRTYLARWQGSRDVDLADERDAFGYALAGVRWHLLHGRSQDLPLLLKLLAAADERWRIAYPRELALPPAEALRALGTGEVQQRVLEHLSSGDQLVLEDTRALPRAYLVEHVLPSRDAAESEALLREPSFRLGASAVVEGLAARRPAEPAPGKRTKELGRARVVVHAPSEVRVLVEADRPAVLVLNDTFYPGWHASVRGKELPVYPANLMFRAVEVPAGNTEIVFLYAPTSWSRGVWFAFLGLAVGAAAWVVFAQRAERAREVRA